MEGMQEVIREAVFLALREYDKSKIEKSKAKVVHNTRLLLKSYTELKNHSMNAVYCKSTHKREENDYQDVMYSDDEIFIESIKKSKLKTMIMIEHIDMALSRVKEKHIKAGSIEKYNAMWLLYVKKYKKVEIAEKLNCSEKSCNRWIKEVEEDIAINLFGINSIEYLVV